MSKHLVLFALATYGRERLSWIEEDICRHFQVKTRSHYTASPREKWSTPNVRFGPLTNTTKIYKISLTNDSEYKKFLSSWQKVATILHIVDRDLERWHAQQKRLENNNNLTFSMVLFTKIDLSNLLVELTIKILQDLYKV